MSHLPLLRAVLSLLLAGFVPLIAVAEQPSEASPDATPPSPACSVEPLGWMTGTWFVDQNGSRVEELWTEPAGGQLMAINRTIREGETTAFEWLRIECRDGQLRYLASPGGRPPTTFTLENEASKLDRLLVFVNPENEYPQRIEYVRESSDHLVARISGGLGTAVLTWDFRRLVGPSGD